MTKDALTPKEYALQFMNSMIAETPELFLEKMEYFDPLDEFVKQAEAAIPGDGPEQETARAKMIWNLVIEFRTYLEIFQMINTDIIRELTADVYHACLNLSILQTLLVRDAFRQTAQKAAGWIELVKTADKDDEDNRKIMLQELTSYMDINLSEKITDSLPLSDKVKMRFPTPIDRFRDETLDLIKTFVRASVAIGIIKKEQFNGEEILVENNRQSHKNLMFGIQTNVESFNSCLDVRRTLFKAQWDEDEDESGMSSAIPGEREGLLKIKLEMLDQAAGPESKFLSKAWMTEARRRALRAIRSLTIGDRAAFKEYAIARKWIKP